MAKAFSMCKSEIYFMAQRDILNWMAARGKRFVRVKKSRSQVPRIHRKPRASVMLWLPPADRITMGILSMPYVQGKTKTFTVILQKAFYLRHCRYLPIFLIEQDAN